MSDNNYLKDEFDQRLQSDATLFDFLQAGSLDGIWYWDLEHPENEWMSPRFWELFGYDPATKKHLASEWQEMIHPDDLQVAIDNFNKHCADPAHPYDQIVRYTHRDGSTIWVRCRGIAIRDQNGKPIRMLGAHNDLTQVLRLKQELAQTIESLKIREHATRTILENSPDTIARYDRNCRRIYVNEAFAAMTDGGVAELLGKKPSEAPGGANAEIYEGKIHEVFTTGQNIQFELKWLGKDDKEICSHIRLTAERDSSGNIISVLGVGRDITELNRYRSELKHNELAKNRFLAAAGHDLRQPLSAANLFIDTLKFTDPTPRQSEIIGRLDQVMGTFSELLNALLNISKLDAGIVKPDCKPIDVSGISNWLEQSFEPLACEKQLEFKLRFPMKERLVVHSDIDLIKSALMNLVANAIKYTAKGSVMVSARRRGNDVLFQVWDTGIGIKTEHIRQVFDEFYQIDNPQRDRACGLGLGLSIAKRALTLLGGKIVCRSQFGRGSVFGFYLPLDNSTIGMKQQDDAAVSRKNVPDNSFARGKHFVVVEDDVMVAQAMTNLLEGMGGKVKCFHSAEDALCHPNIEDADYYIADYMLGGALNGIQFLNQLRQKRGKPINAVLMSGDTSPVFIKEAANCDWPLLHKPANISRLLSSLSAQG
ncbi:MAG TPA: PAS domain-containing protein [Gallionella sp.]|nr:PAS domain-containing protein [Gallionella sp.]